jgi:hypothetical protein
MISNIPGNIYVYIALKTEIIHHPMRYSLFAILSSVSAISLFVFILIIFRSYIERRKDGLINLDEEKKSSFKDIIQTLKIAGRLIKTRHILLLLIFFVYLGENFYEIFIIFSCVKSLQGYHQCFSSTFMVHRLVIIRNMEVNIACFLSDKYRRKFNLDTRKRLLGLHGILLGAGEIVGQ